MATTPKTEGTPPMFYATVRYKLWVREQMQRRKMTIRALAEKLQRMGMEVTPAGVHVFLGKEDEMPKASNTALMPALNKIFNAPPPPICDPTDPLEQLKDRIAEHWHRLTDSERKIVYTVFGVEPPTDGNASLLAEHADEFKSSASNTRRLTRK
jgi:hypothetical protein